MCLIFLTSEQEFGHIAREAVKLSGKDDVTVIKVVTK